MEMKIIILVVVLGMIVETTLGFATSLSDLEKPKKCNMERVHKLLGYNCAHLNLRDIPQGLKSKTEVLDVSYNRIKELTRESFVNYSDLKYLYLFDNMIQNVEDDTFAQLSSLEAIDLTNNGLRTIPPELFNLPRLRNLYVADNGLYDLDRQLSDLPKPFKAPLKILSLASTNRYNIPALGILPDLYFLNISNNPIKDITPQQFSPMCNLKEVDLNNTHMGPCVCQTITTFLLRKRQVELKSSFYCDASSQELISCTRYNSNSTIESNEFAQCASMRQAAIQSIEARLTWTRIAFGLASFLVCFIGILYCLHRRNVRQIHQKSKINNLNVKPVIIYEPESTEEAKSHPEKLLITKSDLI